VAAQRRKLAEVIPYSSWSAFLRWLATQGNETALAILRSRKDLVEPEQNGSAKTSRQTRSSFARETWQERKQTILGDSKLNPMGKRTLFPVAHMRRFEVLEATQTDVPKPHILQGLTYSIDAKGSVLFTLAAVGLSGTWATRCSSALMIRQRRKRPSNWPRRNGARASG